MTGREVRAWLAAGLLIFVQALGGIVFVLLLMALLGLVLPLQIQ